MSKEERSLVTDSNGHIVGVDTTVHHSDGSSTTTHQEAITNPILPTSGGRITGVTENKSDGSSKNYPR
jgi:hypothetical protein